MVTVLPAGVAARLTWSMRLMSNSFSEFALNLCDLMDSSSPNHSLISDTSLLPLISFNPVLELIDSFLMLSLEKIYSCVNSAASIY